MLAGTSRRVIGSLVKLPQKHFSTASFLLGKVSYSLRDVSRDLSLDRI